MLKRPKNLKALIRRIINRHVCYSDEAVDRLRDEICNYIDLGFVSIDFHEKHLKENKDFYEKLLKKLLTAGRSARNRLSSLNDAQAMFICNELDKAIQKVEKVTIKTSIKKYEKEI